MNKYLFHISLLLTILFSACTKKIYLPVETVKTEYTDRFHRDSIYIRDSVNVISGKDTVFFTRWRTQYHDRILHDSIIIRDSIQVAYPVEVVKEINQLTGWQNFQLWLGRIILICFLLWFLTKKKIKRLL